MAHLCGGPRIARSMVTTQKFHQQVEARHFALCGLSGTEHFLATLQAKKVLQVLESSERGNNRTICNLSPDHLVSFCCTIVQQYNEMSTFSRSFNQSKYYIRNGKILLLLIERCVDGRNVVVRSYDGATEGKYLDVRTICILKYLANSMQFWHS